MKPQLIILSILLLLTLVIGSTTCSQESPIPTNGDNGTNGDDYTDGDNGINGNDVTPPIISAVSSTNITETTATITWTTNEAATSQVEYGLTTAYGSATTLNENLVTSHNVTVTGLSPNTTYYYRVKSRDLYGNMATSIGGTLGTVAYLVDDIAPTDPTGLALSTGLDSLPDGTSSVWVRGTWTPSTDTGSGISHYIVEWWTSETTDNHEQGTVASHEVVITDAKGNITYYMKVKAVDRQGNQSVNWSAAESILSAKDTTPPNDPTGLTAYGVVAGIRISWSGNSEADLAEYILYRNTSNDPDSASEIWRGRAREFTDGSCDYEQDYYYWLKAVDTSGNESGFSDLAANCPIQKGYSG